MVDMQLRQLNYEYEIIRNVGGQKGVQYVFIYLLLKGKQQG